MAQEVLVWNDFGFAEALTYGLVERLTNVVENVVYVLNAHREAYEIGCHASLSQLFVGELSVGVACGVEHTGACVGHMGNDVDHL